MSEQGDLFGRRPRRPRNKKRPKVLRIRCALDNPEGGPTYSEHVRAAWEAFHDGCLCILCRKLSWYVNGEIDDEQLVAFLRISYSAQPRWDHEGNQLHALQFYRAP